MDDIRSSKNELTSDRARATPNGENGAQSADLRKRDEKRVEGMTITN